MAWTTPAEWACGLITLGLYCIYTGPVSIQSVLKLLSHSWESLNPISHYELNTTSVAIDVYET